VQVGPFEYCAIAIFSMTMIASLASSSLSKGMASGLIGMIAAMVGVAPIDSFPRFTFGIHELDNGFDLLPALIGLFAISEILKAAERELSIKDQKHGSKLKDSDFPWRNLKAKLETSSDPA
jgi:putative tricarboxylic transport membrane protein